MNSLEIDINKSWDKAVFLRLISAFAARADFKSFLDMTDDICRFFKNSTDSEILSKLKEINDLLDSYVQKFIKLYGVEIYSSGITYGWLEEKVELCNFRLYSHVPFQFRLGIGVHKGYFALEEEVLLKDAFNMLAKSVQNYKILQAYGRQQTEKFSKIGDREFDQ